MSRSPRVAILALGSALCLGGAFACGGEAEEDERPMATEERADPEPPPAPAEEEPGAAAAPPPGRPPATETERQAVERAREAAQHLGRTLKTRLMAAMAEGPREAIEVCATEAQELTSEAARAQGAEVGRSSLKLRNPDNDGPPWVKAWLEAHGERTAQGVTPAVGITGDPAVARFVGPIALEGPCLMCHGAAEGIAEPVRSVLSQRYPEDRATGYAAGDLRGAVWAEIPVEPAAVEP